MSVTHGGVDEYASGLPDWMQTVFQQVRMLLLTFPQISERMRYNTPFYDCNGKMMLYLTRFQKTKLVMGFCNGYLLEDHEGLLKNEQHQTQVRHWEFMEGKPINEQVLVKYIIGAIHLQQTISNKHEHSGSKRR